MQFAEKGKAAQVDLKPLDGTAGDSKHARVINNVLALRIDAIARPDR